MLEKIIKRGMLKFKVILSILNVLLFLMILFAGPAITSPTAFATS